jgi:hypothetical protein
MNFMHDLKVLLNESEEPVLIYVSNELVMSRVSWNHGLLDPWCGPDWITLIKTYKNFSGVEEKFQFAGDSFAPYKNKQVEVPKKFTDFPVGILAKWVE